LSPGDQIVSFQRPTTVTVVLESGRICRVFHVSGQPADAYADMTIMNANATLDLFTCKLVPNLEYIVEQHLFQWFQCKTLSSTKINRLA
jgi:hypothetical protein